MGGGSGVSEEEAVVVSLSAGTNKYLQLSARQR